MIWVPGGAHRPYKVPENVTASKNKKYKYYIRYNSSTIEAKGDLEHELFELANQVPFDDRPNQQATVKDISRALVSDYLSATGSRLADEVDTIPFAQLLQQMDLLVGPEENTYPKNIALMMFNPDPSKFFPYTQAEIVIFPKGRMEDPSNFIEVPAIKGPVDKMIGRVMDYLRTHIIKERIHKLPDRPEAERNFNYPEAALEESVANAVYHRDYQTREPIEIIIEPDGIRIINYGGPDRSVQMNELNQGRAFCRRYRNRRLGDFLKELDLTEGRCTGIPTIIRKMQYNGSPAPTFQTDDYRTSFMTYLPIHPAFQGEPVLKSENGTVNGTVKLTDSEQKLLHILIQHPEYTYIQLQEENGISRRTLARMLSKLQNADIIKREGSDKTGHWLILKQ